MAERSQRDTTSKPARHSENRGSHAFHFEAGSCRCRTRDSQNISVHRARSDGTRERNRPVHQTGGATTSSTFNSYSDNAQVPNGAHFLIDKNGTIYQTASLNRSTNHVGKLQSRCITTLKCSTTDLRAARRAYKAGPTASHRHESRKAFPERYPANSDSIGIELVGMYYPDEKTAELVYESVTAEQNHSLKWLIRELSETLNVRMNEIYRHPEIGRKNATEASTASWE